VNMWSIYRDYDVIDDHVNFKMVCNYAHYMLIFQLHLPHVTLNSMQALVSVNYLNIIVPYIQR